MVRCVTRGVKKEEDAWIWLACAARRLSIEPICTGSVTATSLWVEKDISQIERVIDITQSCGALEITLTHAREQTELAKKALVSIAPSAYKDELIIISDFVISRTVWY